MFTVDKISLYLCLNLWRGKVQIELILPKYFSDPLYIYLNINFEIEFGSLKPLLDLAT